MAGKRRGRGRRPEDYGRRIREPRTTLTTDFALEDVLGAGGLGGGKTAKAGGGSFGRAAARAGGKGTTAVVGTHAPPGFISPTPGANPIIVVPIGHGPGPGSAGPPGSRSKVTIIPRGGTGTGPKPKGK